MLALKAQQPVAGNELLSQVTERCGVKVQECYQCGKCTAGCPIAPFMDLMPRQVMRAVQLGQSDLVFRSSTIWLCASCQTCSARCPLEIDIARVMDVLRHLARRQGVKPAQTDIVLAHDLFLGSVRRLGRLYEVGLVAGLNLGTRRPLANVLDVGLPLLLRRKLHPLPRRAGGAQIRQMFAAARQRTGTSQRGGSSPP